MGKDLHNMDDLFNSAYKQFEDDPSTNVWEKINAGLDKKDADSYKKRLIGWKRVAALLMLLLTGFILYDSGILKKGSRHVKENIPVADGTEKSEARVVKKDAISDQDRSVPGKPGTKDVDAVSKNITGGKDISARVIITKNDNILSVTTDKREEQKARVEKRKTKTTAGNDQVEISITPPTPGKYKKDFLKNYESLSKEKTIIPVIENNTGEIAANLLNGIGKIHFPVLTDSLFTNTTAKNKKQKLSVNFNPYWTMTGFASNDWASYRLESDLQDVKKIEQHEAHDPSFSAGALLTRQFTPHWALQTGLVYSNTSIGISPQKIYAFNDPAGSVAYKYVTSSGYGYVKPGFGAPPAVGDSLTATEAKHTLKHISVPLVIKYKIGKNKLSFIPGIGIAANFQTSAKIETEVEDASHKELVSINKLNGTRSFYLSFTAEAELQYKLTHKVSVSFRPAFRYAISPITKDNIVETYPYSFGAGLGLTYRF